MVSMYQDYVPTQKAKKTPAQQALEAALQGEFERLLRAKGVVGDILNDIVNCFIVAGWRDREALVFYEVWMESMEGDEQLARWSVRWRRCQGQPRAAAAARSTCVSKGRSA